MTAAAAADEGGGGGWRRCLLVCMLRHGLLVCVHAGWSGYCRIVLIILVHFGNMIIAVYYYYIVA